MAKPTALYDVHAALGAQFTDFAGWSMPLRYGSELAEHHAVRQTAGLFDLSHMGEIEVTGPQAGQFLDYAGCRSAGRGFRPRAGSGSAAPVRVRTSPAAAPTSSCASRRARPR